MAKWQARSDDWMYPYYAKPGESLPILSRRLQLPLPLLITCNPHIRRPRRKFRRTQVILIPLFIPPYAPYSPYPPQAPLTQGYLAPSYPADCFSEKGARSSCYSKESSCRV
jgi:hypothetical protein